MSRLRMSCGCERKPAAAGSWGSILSVFSWSINCASVVSKTFCLHGCNETNSVVVFYVVFGTGTNHLAV